MFYMIVKKKWETSLMRSADVFEPDKFVGVIQAFEGTPKKSPKTILRDALAKAPEQESYELVGVAIVGVGSAVTEGHRIISNGTHWTLLERMCDALVAGRQFEEFERTEVTAKSDGWNDE